MAAGRAFLTPLCWHARQGGTQGHGWGTWMGHMGLGQRETFRILLQAGKNIRHGENQPAQVTEHHAWGVNKWPLLVGAGVISRASSWQAR